MNAASRRHVGHSLMGPSEPGNHLTQRGWTLIELLVVVAIIAGLLAILVPALSRARLQARVAKVRSELYQLAIGLETYHAQWKDYPWASAFCFAGGAAGEAYNRLPPELNHKYIGGLGEDLFNPGQKYKYLRDIGWNNGEPGSPITVWYPKRFPYDRPDGNPRDDLWQAARCKSGPITFAIWSTGPGGDPFKTSISACEIYRIPIPKRTWYSFVNRENGNGVIPIIKTNRHGFVQWSDFGIGTRYRPAR